MQASALQVAPITGTRFSLRAAPIPGVDFSGNIACEVLDVIETERLRITWADAAADDPYPWTITWDLRPEGHGTRVLLTHSGFDPDDPVQQRSRTIMRGGWPGVTRRLGQTLTNM
jgi:uncharacterized protein YndB with AHSA1/START domain